MKATIDIPDDLYRQVKAKSALEGRAIREVTSELFERYLNGTIATGSYPEPLAGNAASELREPSRPGWFGIAKRLGAKPADPSLDAIRASIARGWAEESAASEARLRRRKAR